MNKQKLHRNTILALTMTAVTAAGTLAVLKASDELHTDTKQTVSVSASTTIYSFAFPDDINRVLNITSFGANVSYCSEKQENMVTGTITSDMPIKIGPIVLFHYKRNQDITTPVTSRLCITEGEVQPTFVNLSCHEGQVAVEDTRFNFKNKLSHIPQVQITEPCTGLADLSAIHTIAGFPVVTE